MGDNLPPNVGAEEISEKMKDCCVGLASRPVMACDVQDSERHESVQKEFIKKESQKAYFSERLRKIGMGDFYPEMMRDEELTKKVEDLSIPTDDLLEWVQQFFIKEGNQKGLDRPLFVAGSEFEEQKLVPIKTNVPSDEIAELTKDEQIYDEYSRLFQGVIDLCIEKEFSRKQLEKSHSPSSSCTKNMNSDSDLNFKQFFTRDRVRGAFVALLQKEDFVNMIWPEIVKEMLRYYE